MHRPPIKIGVIGSASTALAAEDWDRVSHLAERLGKKIAAASCVLGRPTFAITGADTGHGYAMKAGVVAWRA